MTCMIDHPQPKNRQRTKQTTHRTHKNWTQTNWTHFDLVGSSKQPGIRVTLHPRLDLCKGECAGVSALGLQQAAKRVADQDLIWIEGVSRDRRLSPDGSPASESSLDIPVDQPWPPSARCTSGALKRAEERVISALSHLMTQVGPLLLRVSLGGQLVGVSWDGR